MNVSIRKATGADVSDVIALDHVAASEEPRRKRLRDGIGVGEVDVIEADGEVVGYVLMHHNFYGNGFIELLYVRADFRRKGLGLALVQHCEKACKTQKLFTSANQSNGAMHGLLSKAGFVKSGVIENLDEGDPEVMFLKRLKK